MWKYFDIPCISFTVYGSGCDILSIDKTNFTNKHNPFFHDNIQSSNKKGGYMYNFNLLIAMIHYMVIFNNNKKK